MSELVYICLTGIVGTCSGILGTYVMGKRVISDEAIMNKIDMILTNTLEDTDMQKKIYGVGILLGSGIAQGTGLKGGGGKMNLQNILGEGIGLFIQKMMGGVQTQQQQQPPSTDIIPTQKW